MTQPQPQRSRADMHSMKESYITSPMALDHFYLFTAWANFSRETQARLQQKARSPLEIVALATEKGYNISTKQLSHFSQPLRESYWVWNQKDY
jgi:hypothetical protein